MDKQMDSEKMKTATVACVPAVIEVRIVVGIVPGIDVGLVSDAENGLLPPAG